jgi:type I restriction enzyme, S subunit
MEVKLGYKKCEVGVIPEDWDVKVLGQLSEFVTSGSRGWARHYSDRGPIFVRSQNIRYGYLDFTDQQCVIPPAGAEGSRTRLKQSDLLITMTGNSVGNVAWLEQDLGEAYISQHVGLVRLSEPSFAEYICLFLAPGSPGNSQIWASQTGQSKPGLNLKNLEDLWVALPPHAERDAIAEALSDVDGLLGGLDRLISKKRDLKQAAMQQLLTGHTRLPGFHGEWEVNTLGEIADVKTGPFGSSLHESDYVRDGTPIITVEHLGEFGVKHFNLPLVSDTDRQRLRAYSLEVGDIVFSRVGSVDRNALIRPSEAGWLFSGRLLRVRPDKKKAFAQFLSYQFHGEAFKGLVRNVAVGQTMACLNTQILKGILVRLPSVPEQTAIAKVLSDLDAELAALEQRREKTRDLKQAMMQELLTGKTRLVPAGASHA